MKSTNSRLRLTTVIDDSWEATRADGSHSFALEPNPEVGYDWWAYRNDPQAIDLYFMGYGNESSITAQPDRDINPFSNSLRLLSPLLPLRVRQVPLRFSGSFFPGYQSVSQPWFSMVIVRFSGDAGLVYPD